MCVPLPLPLIGKSEPARSHRAPGRLSLQRDSVKDLYLFATSFTACITLFFMRFSPAQ